MLEPSESERCPLKAFDQVAGCFGWPVQHACPMPGNDLWCSLGDRAAEATDLDESFVSSDVESLAGHNQPATAAVERVVFQLDDLG